MKDLTGSFIFAFLEREKHNNCEVWNMYEYDFSQIKQNGWKSATFYTNWVGGVCPTRDSYHYQGNGRYLLIPIFGISGLLIAVRFTFSYSISSVSTNSYFTYTNGVITGISNPPQQGPSKFFINDVYFLSLKKKKYYINDGECIEDFSDITDTQQFFGLTYYSHKIYTSTDEVTTTPNIFTLCNSKATTDNSTVIEKIRWLNVNDGSIVFDNNPQILTLNGTGRAAYYKTSDNVYVSAGGIINRKLQSNISSILYPLPSMYTTTDVQEWTFLQSDSVMRDKADDKDYTDIGASQDTDLFDRRQYYRFGADGKGMLVPLLNKIVPSTLDNDYYEDTTETRLRQEYNWDDYHVLWDDFAQTTSFMAEEELVDYYFYYVDTNVFRCRTNMTSLPVSCNHPSTDYFQYYTYYYIPDDYEIVFYRRSGKVRPYLGPDMYSYGVTYEEGIGGDWDTTIGTWKTNKTGSFAWYYTWSRTGDDTTPSDVVNSPLGGYWSTFIAIGGPSSSYNAYGGINKGTSHELRVYSSTEVLWGNEIPNNSPPVLSALSRYQKNSAFVDSYQNVIVSLESYTDISARDPETQSWQSSENWSSTSKWNKAVYIKEDESKDRVAYVASSLSFLTDQRYIVVNQLIDTNGVFHYDKENILITWNYYHVPKRVATLKNRLVDSTWIHKDSSYYGLNNGDVSQDFCRTSSDDQTFLKIHRILNTNNGITPVNGCYIPWAWAHGTSFNWSSLTWTWLKNKSNLIVRSKTNDKVSTTFNFNQLSWDDFTYTFSDYAEWASSTWRRTGTIGSFFSYDIGVELQGNPYAYAAVAVKKDPPAARTRIAFTEQTVTWEQLQANDGVIYYIDPSKVTHTKNNGIGATTNDSICVVLINKTTYATINVWNVTSINYLSTQQAIALYKDLGIKGNRRCVALLPISELLDNNYFVVFMINSDLRTSATWQEPSTLFAANVVTGTVSDVAMTSPSLDINGVFTSITINKGTLLEPDYYTTTVAYATVTNNSILPITVTSMKTTFGDGSVPQTITAASSYKWDTITYTEHTSIKPTFMVVDITYTYAGLTYTATQYIEPKTDDIVDKDRDTDYTLDH